MAEETRPQDDRRDYQSPRLEHFGDLSTLTHNQGMMPGDQELGSAMPMQRRLRRAKAGLATGRSGLAA